MGRYTPDSMVCTILNNVQFLFGLVAPSTVADLGFYEGGFIRSGTLARPRKFLQTTPTSCQKTTPFYVVEQYPRC